MARNKYNEMLTLPTYIHI